MTITDLVQHSTFHGGNDVSQGSDARVVNDAVGADLEVAGDAAHSGNSSVPNGSSTSRTGNVTSGTLFYGLEPWEIAGRNAS